MTAIRFKSFAREVSIRSADGSEELLTVSHITGVTPRSEKNVNMFEAESLEGYKIVEPGDLVVNTMWAWMGALGVARTRGIVSPAYGVYRLDPSKVDPRYVEAHLKQPQIIAEITARSTGVWSSRLRLYADELLDMRIELPPLVHQRAVADYLDHETTRLDAVLARRRDQRTILDLRRRAIVDGLTVPAALGGQADRDGGWRVSKRKHASAFFTDGDWIESPHITTDGIRLIQTGNIGEGEFRDHGFRYISEDTFDALGCTEVRPGDILISRLAGTVGRACLAPDLGTRMVVSVDVVIMRPTKELDPRFVVAYLSSSYHLELAELLARGTTMARLSRSQVGEMPLPTPPLREQLRIADAVAEHSLLLGRAVAALDRQIDLLLERRQALITAAMTGQLEIPGVAA